MQPERKTTVNITNRTIVRTIFWVISAILFYRFVGKITHPLTLIFASFFLAMALNPAVNWISRRFKIKSRVKATALTYVTVVLLIGGFFALVVPPLVRQTRDFIQETPKIVSNFQSQDTSVARLAKKYNVNQKLSTAAKDFASHYDNFGSVVLDTGKKVAQIIASVLVVLVMTFMMLVEGPAWLNRLWGVTPSRHREHNKELAKAMYGGVTGFVNGQVILAVVAGFFAFIALFTASHVLDVSINALALAGIVSVFGLIPLFGNPISSAVVILVCLLNSLTLALVMLAYFVVYYFIENHTIQPIIQSRLNNLTPLTVFVAAIIGVGFGGLLGAIIAIPAATAVKILLEDYFKQRDGRSIHAKA